LLRFRHWQGDKTVLFYNRLPAYTLALLAAVILKFRTVLDLEDGDVVHKSASLSYMVSLLMRNLFDRLCSGGSLLACSALKNMTQLRPVACYYGSVPAYTHNINWSSPQLKVLLGGTISRDTGSLLLVEAIKNLRLEKAVWCQQMIIEITGKGDAIEDFAALDKKPGYPIVILHRRLTDDQYSEVVSSCHVGLALKPNLGDLANTTFPSKVIELAGTGLLVLTTNISDVQKVLSIGALYLEQDSPFALIEHLRWIVTHRSEAATIAKLGNDAVIEKCSPKSVARQLSNFLFK
jgi:glycosyltransferase involved in cell wall biosynthesis